MAGLKRWIWLVVAGTLLGAGGGGVMARADTTQEGVLAVAAKDGHYTRFIEAARSTGLAEVLQGDGPFTIFMPTDKAFSSIEPATRDKLFLPSSRDRLTDILDLHVVLGDITLETALQRASLTSEQGQALKLSRSGKTVLVNDALVIGSGTETANGRFYTIDKVLMPRQ